MIGSLLEYEKECLRSSGADSADFCPTVFDGAMCWTRTPAGTDAMQSCSNKYVDSELKGHATLQCDITGKWTTNNFSLSANYTQCGQFYLRLAKVPDIYFTWIPRIQKTCHIGYATSIVSLLIAVFIFIYFKRLHCSRNSLHMHLFASSIMRSLMSLINDVLFDKTTLLEDANFNQDVAFQSKNGWLCETVISLRQYFIMANYMMLLMEGLYLHNLIYLSVFSDKSSIKFYGFIGWVTPVIFITAWIVAKLSCSNTFCWTIQDTSTLFLEIPTGVIVLINFVLFILIMRVLCLKLDSMYQQRRKRYGKLLKSTLLLLPLFGVPYTISVILSFYVENNRVLEIVWLFFDQIFTAYQGFIAALTYCLLNSDVQIELKRKYYYLKERNREMRRSRTISNTLQSYLERCEESDTQPRPENGGSITTKF